uniref:Uncharacterized protein n=1 Tax=Anguilla anguilla TaxID=7936 RepID=A0A0E9PL62_ANGAN
MWGANTTKPQALLYV